MARQSRWKQFADSFNAVYGTVTGVAQDFELARAANKDYTDDAGNILEGAEADRARYDEMARIYTKYGQPDKGIGLQSDAAVLTGQRIENDINLATKDDQILQRGLLASNEMRSVANRNNASAAASSARARRTNALTPYEVEELRLANEEAALGLSFDRDTYDDRVGRERALRRSEEAAADLAVGTVDSGIARANAENSEITAEANLGAGLANDANAVRQRENALLRQAASMDFDTPEEAEEWFTSQVRRDPLIPYARKNEIISAVDKHRLMPLMSRAAELTAKADDAIRTGGLDGLVDFYETVNDGGALEVVRSGDRVAIAQKSGGQSRIIEEARGPDAEKILINRVRSIISDPGSAMEVAATEADVARVRALTDRTRQAIEQTRAEIAMAGSEGARMRLVEEGLIKLLSDPAVATLDTETLEKVRFNYLSAFGLTTSASEDVGPPPEGVSEEQWRVMTPEERRLFR